MLIVLLIVQLFICADVNGQVGGYKAAVLDYSPIPLGKTPRKNFAKNIAHYTSCIKKASKQGAQIIVLPEYGLTVWNIDRKSLEKFSTKVPNPSYRISPCAHGNYSQFFVDLSCAARKNSIYVVVNLSEQGWNSRKRQKVLYSTNVAFDRNGTVVARNRKLDRNNETDNEIVHQVNTFKTDFCVTFGIFTFYDMVFSNPKANILSNPDVTDIAFPAVWVSELPFYEALSTYHGYAKANEVNLLVAGANEPKQKIGGSGIYFYNGTIAEAEISGTSRSKLIVQDVPKIRRLSDLSNSCQPSSSFPHATWGSGSGGRYLESINNFQTKLSNLKNYTFKDFDLNKTTISETICSGRSKFCCSFNITVHKTNVKPNYVYKLAAFYGMRSISSVNKTIGVRNCGLVACLNQNNDTCGGRLKQPPRGVRFDHIVVTGNFDVKNSHYQPSTLNFDLLPETEYTFCRKKTAARTKTQITMETTKSQEALLTFGIVGRAFDYDGFPPGAINCPICSKQA